MRVRARTRTIRIPIRSNPPSSSSAEQQSFPIKFTEQEEPSFPTKPEAEPLQSFPLINKELTIVIMPLADLKGGPLHDNGGLWKSPSL